MVSLAGFMDLDLENVLRSPFSLELLRASISASARLEMRPQWSNGRLKNV